MNAQQIDNVVLITVDGLRWQEVFGGVMDSLLQSELTHPYAKDSLRNMFWSESKEKARQKLMPFFWNEIASKGQIYGNRKYGNIVNCTNRFRVSYPGYSEILCGYSDPNITSNAKVNNPNKTVLEWINAQEGFEGRVAAFCSWDVFPYIINEERSGIPVNAGFDKADDGNLSSMEEMLNYMQDEVTGPWYNVRLDAFTHNYALEYMKKYHPRLVYISYGETDDFAHDGNYDHYIVAAHKTDQWIKRVWEFVQSDPVYRDRTALIITTDHGRGTSPMDEWKSHGNIFKGSEEIWLAAIGPGIEPLGEVRNKSKLFQDQVASTVAYLLGFSFVGDKYEAGKPIRIID